MFSVGAAEVGIIVVLAIVVLGPKRLPVAARWLGKLVKQAKGVTKAVKHELEQAAADDDERPSKSEPSSK